MTVSNQSNALYDAYGNLRQERLWDGSRYIVQSKYTYDSLQRVISATDAKGNMKTQSYDPWGQANEITDPSGNLYVMAYDIRNNKIMGCFVAKNNIPAYRANTAANTYKEDYTEEYLDQFGRGVSRKVYKNWPTMSGELSEAYAYDIAGNLVGYTDPKRNLNEDGYTAAYKYDELNRATEVKDALNQLTCVSYTVLGDISSVTLKQTAAGGNTATLYTKSYNELGAVKSRTDASSLATQYSYNTIGLNTKTVDRNGSTQSLTYDALNQLTQATQVSLDGSKSISYKYNYTSPFGYSEQQLYTNGTLTGADSYTYGADGQITQRDITGSVYLSSSLKLQYDDAGRLVDIGAGKQGGSLFYTNYSYTADRLTQVQTNGQQTVSTANTDNAVYEYFPDGKLKKITYPKLNDGTFLTCEYSYNTLGQLASLVNKKGSTILSQSSYTYDENGNIITVNDGQTLKTYVYDKLNRLTEIRPQSGKATKYTYDLMGNRSTEISEKESLNLVNTSYSYRLDNLLQSVTKGTNTTTMTYYADGLRATKSTSAATTHYIYDLSGRLVAEGQNTTSVSANYVWGPDRVLSKKDSSGGEYYYLYNGHGDVIQIVDRNGNVVNNYKYDEWGNILTSSETISNPFLYAGEVYDKETGLYYLRARYYDPSVGRFINEDPVEGQIDNPLSMNLYTYCWNNPTLYVDPTGNGPIISWLIKTGERIANGTLKIISGGKINTADVGAFFLMMDKDKKGVYHANYDCWQQYFGYNNVYDVVFDIGTSMDKAKFPFIYNDEELIFWAWKGDYINLGAGAELGIYKSLEVNGVATGQWIVDKDLALPMTLTLQYKGNTIIEYNPGEQWWITGFNPAYKGKKASDLTAIYTIYFSNNKDMFKKFYDTWNGVYDSDGNIWHFDATNYTATLEF